MKIASSIFAGCALVLALAVFFEKDSGARAVRVTADEEDDKSGDSAKKSRLPKLFKTSKGKGDRVETAGAAPASGEEQKSTKHKFFKKLKLSTPVQTPTAEGETSPDPQDAGEQAAATAKPEKRKFPLRLKLPKSLTRSKGQRGRSTESTETAEGADSAEASDSAEAAQSTDTGAAAEATSSVGAVESDEGSQAAESVSHDQPAGKKGPRFMSKLKWKVSRKTPKAPKKTTPKKGKKDKGALPPPASPQAEALAWPFTSTSLFNEIEVYRPKAKELSHKKQYDSLAPISANQNENLTALEELLSSDFVTDGVTRAIGDLCERVQHAVGEGRACPVGSVPQIDCSRRSLEDMKAFLEAFEYALASAPAVNACGEAYAESVALHDLLVIQVPLSPRPIRSPADMKSRLDALFAPGTPTPIEESSDSEGSASSTDSGSEADRVTSTSASPASGSSADAAVRAAAEPEAAAAEASATQSLSMLELKKQQVEEPQQKETRKPKRDAKPSPPADNLHIRPLPCGKHLTRELHATAPRRLFFTGVRNPVVSVIYNLLFQAWNRWDELFADEGACRPFPRISTLLRVGSEQRLTQLDGLCGVALKKLKGKPKTPARLPVVPREKFFRRTRVAGVAQFSCDLLNRAARAFDLGESAGVGELNSRMESLDDDMKARSLSLERNASAGTNYRRICLAFRHSVENVPHISNVLSCAFGDTVLANNTPVATPHGRASPEGSDAESAAAVESAAETTAPEAAAAEAAAPEAAQAASSVESTALLQTQAKVDSPAVITEGDESPEEKAASAQRVFNWFKLRGEAKLDAANLRAVLRLDYETWWLSLLLGDERSLKEMRSKAKASCKEAAKKELSGDAEVCTRHSQKKWWDKTCAKKVSRFDCEPVKDVSGFVGYMKEMSTVVAALAAHDTLVKKPSQKEKGRPFATLANDSAAQKTLSSHNAYAVALISAFQFYSQSVFSNKELLHGLGPVAAWESSLLQALFAGKGKKSWLFGRFTGALLRRFGSRLAEKAYTPEMMHFLHRTLRPDTRQKMFQAIKVVVHPLAMKHLNQMAALYSDKTGRVNKAGGFAQEVDKTIQQWTRHGMTEKMVERLEKGEKLTPADYAGVNILTMPVPVRERLDSLIAERLEVALNNLAGNPENVEVARAGCDFASLRSNALEVIEDSRYLLKHGGGEGLMFLGKVVDPGDTSLRARGFFAKTWSGMKKMAKSILRLPPYQAQHFVFAGVQVRDDLVSQVVQEMASIYNRNAAFFKNEIAFRKAVSELVLVYEHLLRDRRREPFMVPVTSLLDNINPDYAQMDGKPRQQEFQTSALSQIFAQAWSLFFSVSMNNFINPLSMEKLENEYSKDAWKKSVTDNLAVNSFRSVFLGSDLPLMLYDQLIPKAQKQMLKRSKYGVATMFAYQTVMTGRLYAAQSLPNLGMFLQAQGPYFGETIIRWQRKRRMDRIIEIFSWISLGLFCFGAVSEALRTTSQAVEHVVQNQSSLSPSVAGCPPLGICADGSIGDPIASPPTAAASAVFQSMTMIGLGMAFGPAIAVWRIAVSHVKILSRFEMAIGNAFRRIGRWFRAKWRGRWFTKKQNDKIRKEMEKHASKLKAHQRSLITHKSENFVDQPVPAVAPTFDDIFTSEGSASAEGSNGGFFEIESVSMRKPRTDRSMQVRRHDLLVERLSRM